MPNINGRNTGNPPNRNMKPATAAKLPAAILLAGDYESVEAAKQLIEQLTYDGVEARIKPR